MKFVFRNIRLFSTKEVVRHQHDPTQKKSTIILQNPQKRNTLSLATINKLSTVLSEVTQRIKKGQSKIVILKAQGPVFSSGHDLKELQSSKNPQQIFKNFTNAVLTLRNLSVPTICAIDGITAAAGLQLALSCDLIIATQKSTFSTPGVKWGLFCSTPAVQLIRSISSKKKAMEMILFGQPITAQQAYHYGMINKIVTKEQLFPQIDKYVKKVGKLSGEVIALGKRAYSQQSQKKDIEQAYCTAIAAMKQNVEKLSDCQQGLKAFSQKRQPQFKK